MCISSSKIVSKPIASFGSADTVVMKVIIKVYSCINLYTPWVCIHCVHTVANLTFDDTQMIC